MKRNMKRNMNADEKHTVFDDQIVHRDEGWYWYGHF